MWARVTRFEGSPDRVEDGIRLIQEQTIPQARQLPGFQGGYWCVDRQSGKGMAVTLWESEDALRQSEAQAEQIRSQAGEAVGASDMQVEAYEVVGQA